MCGIAGFWGPSRHDAETVVRQMTARLSHRGPDDAGWHSDPDAGFAFGQTRLSVVDLSPAGHQPMASPCGRFMLIYNGELYDHLTIRADLEAVGASFPWRGHSDTETLLAALRHWGVDDTLQRLDGMFAFALWDSVDRTLILARDRLGIKPLYYGTSGATFLFGSELKALAQHPDWSASLNRDALALYFRHGYVPGPWSSYAGIHKLPPAHYVVIRDEGQSVSEPHAYWSLLDAAARGASDPFRDAGAAVDTVHDLLLASVRRRMVADVPLGAFLSGGIDSSTVTALMQAQSGRPVRTFSIGFREAGYDEAVYAKEVAAHLGTDHTELYVTADEAMAVIPELPRVYDEPFADASQIPTYLVSRLARRHVTVSLSGDGGDELFYGYDRYRRTMRAWERLARLPRPARRMSSAIASRLPGEALDQFAQRLPGRRRIGHLTDRLPRLAALLRADDPRSFYREFVSATNDPVLLVPGSIEPRTSLSDRDAASIPGELRELMMYVDAVGYLPDAILTKLDRASMANGLEARVPLLDHRIVETAWRVPTEMKERDGRQKWLLREVLDRYVPSDMVDRPKQGFAVPLGSWLRGPLRDWGEELLAERALRDSGVLDPRPIRHAWEGYLTGSRRWHPTLWSALMFQAWWAAREDTAVATSATVHEAATHP